MASVLDNHHYDHELEDHDRGLVFDLATLDRRQVLKLLGFGGVSAGMFVLAGCAPAGSSAAATATSAGSSATAATGASCAVIPEATAGPDPGRPRAGLPQGGVI